jgi:Tfp pilus assembly protein PilF
VLENALIQYPEEAMLYFLKGVSLERLERSKEAEAVYQRAIELGGQSPELHRQMASYFAQQGDALKAIQHLVSVLEVEPEDLETLEALAHLLRQQSKWTASQQVLKRLLASHPTHATAWIQLAETHEQLGQVPEAIEVYNQALSLTGNRALELRKSLVVSPVPPASEEEAKALQHRIEISLKALSLNPPRLENPAVDLGVTPRVLMQQGLWHDGLATLWKDTLSGIQRLSKADFTQAVSSKTTHQSIVIITRDLGSSSAITPAWMPPLHALDRKDFRVHWIQIGSSIHAPQGSRFNEADTTKAIPSHDWQGIQEAILSQSPDVLVFSDAFKDVVSMALYLGNYAQTQLDLATCTPSCLAPLRPLSSTSKRFKEDFGANYEYPLLAIEVLPSRWTLDFVKGIQRLLEANPLLQVVLYFVGEEALESLLSVRLKAVLSEDTQNRLTWMPLPYAEAQRLFQVADAVLRLDDTCRSPLIDYAFAFGTSLYHLADLEGLIDYLRQPESERQAIRQKQLDERYTRYTPAFIESQAQALVAQF